jgi:hypothetical protein
MTEKHAKGGAEFEENLRLLEELKAGTLEGSRLQKQR